MPRFVVVERGQELSRLVKRYLEDVQVESIEGTQQALEMVREVPVSAVLVNGFCDGDLPSLDRGLARLPGAPPIITCWLAGDDIVARGLGIARYLPKPVTRRQLLSSVEAIGIPVQTILLVDDEPEVLRLFTRMLYSGERRYRVLRATTGARALHLLRSEKPDVVILDLVMPEMDGLQLLHVKAEDPAIESIPVIAVSAKGLSAGPMRSDRIAITSYGGVPLADLLACVRIVAGLGREAGAAPSKT
jgi:CheY-like chemotaxis protein